MSENLRKYFNDLEFDPNETPNLIQTKKRWKELARRFHPDIPTGSRKEFDRVTHAYQMIVDPSYRHKEMVNDMKKGANQRGDLNIRIQCPVHFDDAFFGRIINMTFNTLQYDEDYKPIIEEGVKKINVVAHAIRLPAGSVGGYEHLMHGCGHTMGGNTGDVIIVFTPLTHSKFQVRGRDVYSQERQPLEVLLKGDIIDVQTMWGVKKLKVPPGTQPGAELKIKNAGVLEQGEQVCVISPIFPTKEELRKGNWGGLDIKWELDEPEEDKEEEILISIFGAVRRKRDDW